MVRLCILLWAVVGAFGCSTASEPPRPAGVPADAVWVGGADGGVFVRLEKRGDDAPPTYDARVYADVSGDLLFEGPLIMVPKDHAPIALADSDTFAGWDGEALHLADGARLAARD